MLSCAYPVVSLQLISRDVISLLPCHVNSCMVGQHDLCCNTILLVVFLQTALHVWTEVGLSPAVGMSQYCLCWCTHAVLGICCVSTAPFCHVYSPLSVMKGISTQKVCTALWQEGCRFASFSHYPPGPFWYCGWLLVWQAQLCVG